jgi:hypothetical protein
MLDSSNNIMTQNVRAIRFRDTLKADLRLGKGSRAINRGDDIRKYDSFIKFDYLKNPRPKGKAFDIGAYEVE